MVVEVCEWEMGGRRGGGSSGGGGEVGGEYRGRVRQWGRGGE